MLGDGIARDIDAGRNDVESIFAARLTRLGCQIGIAGHDRIGQSQDRCKKPLSAATRQGAVDRRMSPDDGVVEIVHQETPLAA